MRRAAPRAGSATAPSSDWWVEAVGAGRAVGARDGSSGSGVLFTWLFRAVGGGVEVGVACSEVRGPVLSGVVDPADGGVDVDAEEVGEDRGGQVGGQRGEGTVAGRSGADAVAVELVVETVEVQRLAGDSVREQPAWCVWPAGDY